MESKSKGFARNIKQLEASYKAKEQNRLKDIFAAFAAKSNGLKLM